MILRYNSDNLPKHHTPIDYEIYVMETRFIFIEAGTEFLSIIYKRCGFKRGYILISISV